MQGLRVRRGPPRRPHFASEEDRRRRVQRAGIPGGARVRVQAHGRMQGHTNKAYL